MAIQGIIQPGIIQIDDDLRLRKFDDVHEFALEWYRDEELVWLVDGVRNQYTPERLKRMYHYLDHAGELYFIEAREKGKFIPIGDVTLCLDDLPIVIGNGHYRGKGIGRKVISALISRAKALGFDHVSVGEIYHWNAASRRCFESLGFTISAQTEKGAGYRLELK